MEKFELVEIAKGSTVYSTKYQCNVKVIEVRTDEVVISGEKDGAAFEDTVPNSDIRKKMKATDATQSASSENSSEDKNTDSNTDAEASTSAS